jgi:hypothetical protein
MHITVYGTVTAGHALGWNDRPTWDGMLCNDWLWLKPIEGLMVWYARAWARLVWLCQRMRVECSCGDFLGDMAMAFINH